MKPQFSFYTPGDFGRVLAFLHAIPEPHPTYQACRFQFCMAYHVQALRLKGGFEQTCGIWEDGDGIAALVMTEGGTHWGDTFFIFRSDADKTSDLLRRMCEFAERFTSKVAGDRKSNAFRLCISEQDDVLKGFAAERGYQKTEAYERAMILSYTDDLQPIALPEGFTIRDARSFAPQMSALAHQHSFRYSQDFGDDDGVERAFAAIRAMPDYRPELDLVLFDPEGQPAGLANFWIDQGTQTAHLEPLGVVWWHRRMGLARALILEGVHRTRKLGCIQMAGGDQPFYWDLGFQEKAKSHFWAWSTLQ